MPLATFEISIQLVLVNIAAVEEIQSRIHACAFPAVVDPTKGPELPEVLD